MVFYIQVYYPVVLDDIPPKVGCGRGFEILPQISDQQRARSVCIQFHNTISSSAHRSYARRPTYGDAVIGQRIYYIKAITDEWNVYLANQRQDNVCLGWTMGLRAFGLFPFHPPTPPIYRERYATITYWRCGVQRITSKWIGISSNPLSHVAARAFSYAAAAGECAVIVCMEHCQNNTHTPKHSSVKWDPKMSRHCAHRLFLPAL